LAGGLEGAYLGLNLSSLAILAGPVGLLALPAIMAAGLGIGTLGGAALGATAGAAAVVPEQQAAAIERIVDAVAGAMKLPELTARAVVANAAQHTPFRAEMVEDESPPSSDELPDYRSLRERGFGAVIETKVTNIGFAASGGVDPDMVLFLTAEARLVDTATGQTSWKRGLAYESPRHKASVWTRDGAALTRLGIEQAYRTLAERIVDSALLQTEFRVGRAGLGLPAECGVATVRPKPKWEAPWFGVKQLETSTVDSLTPTLAWEAFPSARDELDKSTWARATSPRYDVRIWDAMDGMPGAVVYERQGLERSEHQVESALQPGSTYFWSVRLRYNERGRPRATRWAASNVPQYVLSAGTRDSLYFSDVQLFRTAQVGCGSTDLTPCGCLDFIPAQNLYRFKTP
jgi:hypothetical protein